MTDAPTGQSSGHRQSVRRTERLGPYEVVVRLDADGTFLGIDRVTVHKDFLDLARKLNLLGRNSPEEFYDPDDS